MKLSRTPLFLLLLFLFLLLFLLPCPLSSVYEFKISQMKTLPCFIWSNLPSLALEFWARKMWNIISSWIFYSHHNCCTVFRWFFSLMLNVDLNRSLIGLINFFLIYNLSFCFFLTPNFPTEYTFETQTFMCSCPFEKPNHV